MSDIPKFFVPDAKEGMFEEAFAELAKFAGGSTPDTAKRIYSIEFKSNGETWTATVGRSLEGYKDKRVSGKRVLSDYERRVSDPAKVLAIIPSIPTTVVTDAAPVGGTPSQWSNPFFAGEISKTLYFSE